MGRITTSDEIYNKLREEILALRFKPGQDLNINSLAEQLNCSRSPVRDALMQLNRDMLVDIFPQRGTKVALIDLHQVEEERFLRKSLETAALIKALPIATQNDYLKMKMAIEKQKLAGLNNDFEALFEADNEFHQVAFDTIKKRWCWSLLEAQSGNYHRIRLLSFSLNSVTDNVIAQHEQILSCVMNKDDVGVLNLIDHHLGKLDNEVELLTKEFKEFFKTEDNKTIKPNL